MPVPMIKDRAKKSSSSSLQNTFHRHRRKIDQLREQIEEQKQQCEIAFALYHSTLRPKEKEAGQLITKYLLTVIDITRSPKSLNEKQWCTLNGFFEKDLEILFSMLPYGEIQQEMRDLYKEVHGDDCETEFYEELEEFKEASKEHGIDLDLSDLDPNDSNEEIRMKLLDALHRQGIHAREDTFERPQKPKSKKELLKEQKALELENIQKQGIGTIYKRLVKELHPDIEQDHEKRAQKVDLMKRVTVAYENNDLLCLLDLESEWLGEVGTVASEASLKSFNALLKDQIEELKEQCFSTALQPRYMDMHSIIQYNPEKPVEMIQHAISRCDNLIEEFDNRLKDLSVKNPIKALREILDFFEKGDNENDFFLEEFAQLLSGFFGKPTGKKKKGSDPIAEILSGRHFF